MSATSNSQPFAEHLDAPRPLLRGLTVALPISLTMWASIILGAQAILSPYV